MNGPLNGVRILDLTTMVSGPMATMMLADQGADVIKIESPRGDHMRHVGSMRKGMSASFLSCNRSKRSLALDIKRPEGLAAVRKLAATADVLVQNFRPGAIERMGLGEDVVRKIRPDIVFVSISGFGETGPYVHQRVYDPVIQALCGLADVQTDYATGQPRMVRTIVPDKTTAVAAAQAITAALYARAQTGEGQHIRLAMLDTMVAYLWPEAISSLTWVGSESDPAEGQMGLDLVYRTADGYITAGAVSDSEWQGMCRALDREDLLEDERFATAGARAKNRPARRDIVGEEMEKRPSGEILARLDREDVPCAPVLTRWQLLDDAQIAANGTIEIHEDDLLGRVRQPRPAARFDRTPASVQALAPYLGADNAAILAELGYSEAEIGRLSEDGVLAGDGPATDC
ncbi:MAG: CoA transferase [Rhodospirillaceae bacterium]|nr:CoA transferase [Rhodospirillaceae bacterium]MCY4067130.1 CoA transferase [Rhodospirillaceae bacterium]